MRASKVSGVAGRATALATIFCEIGQSTLDRSSPGGGIVDLPLELSFPLLPLCGLALLLLLSDQALVFLRLPPLTLLLDASSGSGLLLSRGAPPCFAPYPPLVTATTASPKSRRFTGWRRRVRAMIAGMG